MNILELIEKLNISRGDAEFLLETYIMNTSVQDFKEQKEHIEKLEAFYAKQKSKGVQ